MAGADVVVVSAVRTPIGRFKGGFKDLPAPRLGAAAITAALERARIPGKDVSEVFMGHVIQAGTYQAPARQASIYAGIPSSVGAVTVNRVCGSGMEAMIMGLWSIGEDPSKVIVAGGMENMTRAPYLLPNARLGHGMGNTEVLDSLLTDGLWDVYNNQTMGMAGELIAERLKLTREEIDEFAFRSNIRSSKATSSGRFAKEIVPVEIADPKGNVTKLDKDEGIHPNTSLEALAKLRPSFKKGGVLTAGNSSQLSDGASATVLMSAAGARERGLEPLARIVAWDQQAVPPEEVMFAPIPCVRKLCARTGFKVGGFGLVEHNEAFASASVAVRKELGIHDDVFNVHGGAVALGHPIGCSGNRIVVTLLHSMAERHVERGLATMCIGGGDALAMVLER